MEGITHTLTAAVVTQLGPADWTSGAGIVFVGASLLPDLDSLPLWPEHYLRVHRGPTHSALSAPVLALAPAGAGMLLFGGTFGWLYLASLLGLLLHGFLDWINSYGTKLLWPLSQRRFALDLNTIVDPLITFPMLAATVAMLIQPSLRFWIAIAAVAWLFLHLGWSGWNQRRARRRLERLGAPVAVFACKNSLRKRFSQDSWVGFVGEGEERRAYEVFRGEIHDRGRHPAPAEDRTWPDDSLREAFIAWSRAPFARQDVEEDGTVRLQWGDLRFMRGDGDAVMFVSRFREGRLIESRFAFSDPRRS